MFQRNARTPRWRSFDLLLCGAQIYATQCFILHNAAPARYGDRPRELLCSAATPRRSAIATKCAKVAIKALRSRRTLFTYMRERIYNSAHSVACPWPYAPHPGWACALGPTPCRWCPERRRLFADRSCFSAFWPALLRLRRTGHIACRQMRLASDVFVFVFFLVSLTVCRRRIRLRGARSLVSAGIRLSPHGVIYDEHPPLSPTRCRRIHGGGTCSLR